MCVVGKLCFQFEFIYTFQHLSKVAKCEWGNTFKGKFSNILSGCQISIDGKCNQLRQYIPQCALYGMRKLSSPAAKSGTSTINWCVQWHGCCQERTTGYFSTCISLCLSVARGHVRCRLKIKLPCSLSLYCKQWMRLHCTELWLTPTFSRIQYRASMQP